MAQSDKDRSSSPAQPVSALRSRRSGRRARREPGRPRARLLGARLAPLPARQGRDRERDLHHLADPRRVRRRADRRALRRPRAERHLRRRPRWSRFRACLPAGVLDTVPERRRPARPTSSSSGGEPLGQDEFLRLLYGARVSLEVALLSTIGVMVIGVILGSIAGYFRGWTDTIISRMTEITMAFPLLLFVIALAATVGPQAERDHVRSLPPRGGHARADLHASSAGSTRRGSCAPRCSRSARRNTSRRPG